MRHSGDAIHPQNIVGISPAVGLCSVGITSSRRGNNSRAQLEQAIEIAAIQRQRIDRLVTDRTAQGGVGRVDRRNFSRNRNRLGLFARLQHQIDTNVLTYLNQHTAVLHRPEPLGLRPYGIRAGGQARSHIFSGAIAYQCSRDASGHVDHRHGSGSNGAAALIKYSSLDGALTGL